jgi:subtilisin
MIGPKDRDITELNFSKLLQALKTRDRDLWSLAAGQLGKERWRQMLKEVQEKNPDLYREIIKVYDALIQGQEEMVNSPRVPVLSRAWELAGKLLKNYSCEKGYLDYEEPRIHTATIHLNIEKVVTGLPRELMALSNKIAWDYGGERKWTFGFDNRIFIADLTEDAIEELRKNQAVARVEIEPMAYICSYEKPPYNPNGVNIDWGVDRVNPENAWNKGIFGQGAKLCVIDTGIKSSHECFWKDGVCVFKGGWNFIANNNKPVDDHDHGTYCSGIIAAQHNGLAGSYKGIAPGIELYACKVLDAKGSGSFANVAAGIDWARTHGMHIISMSLGGSQGSSVLQQACDAAWYAGLVLCAAAGNSGPEDNTVNYPARYNSCIAIAATDYDDNVPDFSSRGPEVDMAAPGRRIVGPWAGNTYKDYVVSGSNDRYMCASGTSAATPHVAAGAALVKSWYPLATNLEIRQWITAHCRDI